MAIGEIVVILALHDAANRTCGGGRRREKEERTRVHKVTSILLLIDDSSHTKAASSSRPQRPQVVLSGRQKPLRRFLWVKLSLCHRLCRTLASLFASRRQAVDLAHIRPKHQAWLKKFRQSGVSERKRRYKWHYYMRRIDNLCGEQRARSIGRCKDDLKW